MRSRAGLAAALNKDDTLLCLLGPLSLLGPLGLLALPSLLHELSMNCLSACTCRHALLAGCTLICVYWFIGYTSNSAFLLAPYKKVAHMTQKRTFENRRVKKPEDMIRFNYCYS